MSKWDKFAQTNKAEGGETPTLTMNLRCVHKKNGAFAVEQLVEYRNKAGMIVGTEWVEIPTIVEG